MNSFHTGALSVLDVVGTGVSCWLLAAAALAGLLLLLLLLPLLLLEVLAQLRARRRNKCEIGWMDILQNGRSQNHALNIA